MVSLSYTEKAIILCLSDEDEFRSVKEKKLRYSLVVWKWIIVSSDDRDDNRVNRYTWDRCSSVFCVCEKYHLI